MRSSRLVIGVTAFIALAALAARPARAQNADAEGLFAEGERLQAEGKLAESCDSFEASNRIEARAGTLIRLGNCRELQGRLASAWSAYREALTRVKDPKKRDFAVSRVEALQPRLSYLTVAVPDASRVDGLRVTRNGKELDPALWNRTAPVDGGSYVIAGTAPGHVDWTATVTVANEADKVSIDVPRLQPAAQAGIPPPPGGGDASDRSEGQPGRFTPRRKLAVGLAGLGATAVVGGVVLWSMAKGLEDDAFALCPNPQVPCYDSDEAQDLVARGASRATLANVAFGVGSAALIGAAVVWLTAPGPGPESSTTLAPRLGPGRAGLDLTVRF